MTPPKTNTLPASLLVDFDCNRRCQVEVDVEGVGTRHTLGQMLASASIAHDHAHAADPARVFRFDDHAIVRADMTAAAA